MAKRFRFNLETVLRVREIRQHEAARRLGEKRAELSRIDALIEESFADISRRQTELLETQRSGSFEPGSIVSGRAWIGQIRRNIAQHHAARTQLLREYENLTVAWRAARTQTRVLEKLRERKLQEHQSKAKFREQMESDELAQQLLIYHGEHQATSDTGDNEHAA